MPFFEKKISWQSFCLLAVAAIIFMLGVIMVFNASSASALEHHAFHKRHHAMVKQLFNFIVGLLVCYGFWKMGYEELLKFSPILLGLIVCSLLLVYVPGIGRCVNGSRRWIVIGSFVGQPSEFVKIVIPLFFIHRVVGHEKSVKELLKIFALICVPIVLVLIEPSNGITAMLAATFITLLFLSRISYKWWLWPILAFSIMGAVAVVKVPYVQARIQSYLHPERDLLGKGHQPFQSKVAMGSGGAFGKGFGKSMQKLSYLPEAQNDYIAAIFAEEIGFVGVLFLIVLYMLVALLGFSIALKTSCVKGAVLAASLTFSMSLQAFLNLAVVSGLLPSTGLNLPLFSQGGSSLLANMIVICILLNIAYRSSKSREGRWAQRY